MTSCISPVYRSVVPRPFVSLPHVCCRGSNSLLPMPLIGDYVSPMSLRPYASSYVPPLPTVPHAPRSIPPAHPVSCAFTASHIPVIPPIIFHSPHSSLQPPQDQPILQTPDSSSCTHNFNPAQSPTSSVKSLKRTLYLDGSDDEASALKKFLLFQHPHKGQKVDIQSWSTNPPPHM